MTDHSRTCWRNLRLWNIRSLGRCDKEAEVTRFGTREEGRSFSGAEQRGTREARG